jgi:alpha-tubulin suppressor-like RCC1 family protein
MLTTILLVLSQMAAAQGPKITDISASESHTCALYEKGLVSCWGYNGFGQIDPKTEDLSVMPDPHTVNLDLPAIQILALPRYTCAVLNNHQTTCWGDGELAFNPGPQFAHNSPGDLNGALKLTGRNQHVCVRPNDHEVQCFGGNAFGQSGVSHKISNLPTAEGLNLKSVEFGAPLKVSMISTGSNHTCALIDNLGVKCWGSNGRGELGYDSDVLPKKIRGLFNFGSRPLEVAYLPPVNLGVNPTEIRELVSGDVHNCALLKSGQAKCWGNNRFGALGLGDAQNRGGVLTFTLMGKNLPFIKVNSKSKIRSLSLGAENSCAIFEDHTVKCWGSNQTGVVTPSLGPSEILYGSSAETLDQGIPVISLPAGAVPVKLTVGSYHACALLENNDVYCWGMNRYGLLGGQKSDAQTALSRIEFK